MKRQIYGRPAGSDQKPTLLMESGDAIVSGGKAASPATPLQVEVASTRRAVAALREKRLEGYVVFGDDPTQYPFTPEKDFAYPVVDLDTTARAKVGGGQQLYARIKSSSKYFSQSKVGELFPVFVDQDGPWEYVVHGNNNDYRLLDVDLYVLGSDGQEILISSNSNGSAS